MSSSAVSVVVNNLILVLLLSVQTAKVFFGVEMILVLHFLIVAAIRTERECDRRQAMMDNLVTRHKQLELTFENRDQRHVQRCVLAVKAYEHCMMYCASWRLILMLWQSLYNRRE